MLLHDEPLGLGQRPRLEEDRVGHGDLADVVQQEAELDLRLVAEAQPVDLGEREPVGGDALGVLAGVGVARLDRARERAHGEHVGAMQLLRARALLDERLAQVGGVALRAEAPCPGLVGAPARARPRARRCGCAAPDRSARPSSCPGALVSLPSAARSALIACGSGKTGIPTPLPRPCPSSPVENRISERPPRRPRSAAPSSSVSESLMLACTSATSKSSSAPARAAPRAVSSQRCSMPRPASDGASAARTDSGATTSTRERFAWIAECRTSVSRRRSIGLVTAHSPSSCESVEETETKITGRSRSAASARTASSTSKPFMPGMSTSSVIASKCSRRSRSSAAAPECTWTLSHAERLELLGDERGERRLVVDDEDAARGERRAPPPWPSDGAAGRRGQRDLERRPDADRASHVDRAAVQLDERLDDRQAEARAGAAALVGRAAVEAVEDPPHVLRRHPAAGVARRRSASQRASPLRRSVIVPCSPV